MTVMRCRGCGGWFDKKDRVCHLCDTEARPNIHQAPGWRDNLAKQAISAERYKRF